MLQLSFGEKESFGVWIPHCGRVIPLILRNARSTQWRKAELVERKQCGGKEGRKEGGPREETIEVETRFGFGSTPAPGSLFVGSITGKSTPTLVSVKTPAAAFQSGKFGPQQIAVDWSKAMFYRI